MSYTLIHNGTLIDGNGGEPIQDGAVLIHEGQIRENGRKSDITLPDADITLINAAGGTILPGMIDTHVHMMYNGFALSKLMYNPFSYQFYDAIDNFRRTIEAGVTTVRDAGGADLGVKQAVRDRLIIGPRLQISINLMSTIGGHSDDWLPSGYRMNLFSPYPGRPSGICGGVDSVRNKVRELLQASADVIKICSTGGVSSPQDHPFDIAFSQAELEAIVEEASFRNGTKVMSHAQGAKGINTALRAGVHSIEHGTLIDDEGIELMLKNGAYLVPTLLVSAYARANAAERAATRPPWVLEKGTALVGAIDGQVKRAYEAGVKIAMGTDSGVCPHGLNLQEVGLMCSELGMSPMEAIQATTKVAAECMGWESKIGTLDAGKLADVIICQTDPLANIESLGKADNIVFVMQEGHVVKNQL
ncbi:MAG: amidohydrolase family protein [Chloroflexota bacterium]